MIEVDQKGGARVVQPAANDSTGRKARREETARRTSTAEGLAAFMAEHGEAEGARRIHDAMLGPAADRETPRDSPAGDVSQSWKRR